MSATETDRIKFAVPKGRMYDGVAALLAEAGLRLVGTSRGYRPSIPLSGFETKILKPRAIIEMLDSGDRDLGFAGKDWVEEEGLDLVELLDTGLDRVRLVAAAPEGVLTEASPTDRELVVASEYPNLAAAWVSRRGLNARVLRSYGATEVLPPEDADCIIDNTASGATLVANGLQIVDELMTSTTRLYASRAAMDDVVKRGSIERFAMLVRSVLEARSRVMLEFNVGPDDLEAAIEVLPCMREPTVAPLHGSAGFAVKSAVPRADLPRVIPLVKGRGGSDLVVSKPEQIVL